MKRKKGQSLKAMFKAALRAQGLLKQEKPRRKKQVMPTPNTLKPKERLKLQREWEKKLQDSGFKDYERLTPNEYTDLEITNKSYVKPFETVSFRDDHKLKRAKRMIKNGVFEANVLHYTRLSTFLSHNPKFKYKATKENRKYLKLLAPLFVEGLPFRKCAKEFGLSLNRTYRLYIVFLKAAMKWNSESIYGCDYGHDVKEYDTTLVQQKKQEEV